MWRHDVSSWLLCVARYAYCVCMLHDHAFVYCSLPNSLHGVNRLTPCCFVSYSVILLKIAVYQLFITVLVLSVTRKSWLCNDLPKNWTKFVFNNSYADDILWAVVYILILAGHFNHWLGGILCTCCVHAMKLASLLMYLFDTCRWWCMYLHVQVHVATVIMSNRESNIRLCCSVL